MDFQYRADIEKEIYRVVKLLKQDTSVRTQMALVSVYEDTMGIYPHLSRTDRPLSLVAFHPAEDISTDSLLEDSVSTFGKTNIKETFGINYIEYLSLPREVCAMMVKVATDALRDKNKLIEKTLNDIE
jgi:hypothetical protein